LSRLPVALLTGFLIAITVALPASASPQSDAISQLNQIRASSGLPALKASESLFRSSTRYARKMVATDYFGHASRIAASSAFGRVGETLEMHSGWRPNAGATITEWMNSPGHRAVLMSRAYRWVGMGIARGKIGSRLVTVWVAHVGARR
jgi:uncharacterized protein YkwD